MNWVHLPILGARSGVSLLAVGLENLSYFIQD